MSDVPCMHCEPERYLEYFHRLSFRSGSVAPLCMDHAIGKLSATERPAPHCPQCGQRIAYEPGGYRCRDADCERSFVEPDAVLWGPA
jgi:hypothetical protein